MIPVKLELQNFLAYHHPAPLDFAGLHVACLVGANGAGKSSLLDAITWSLWGRARARRDDELIYGDETEMQVRLTYMIDGHYYRVTRYRSRLGRGSSELGLEIQDTSGWRTLTEPTIRATQEKIIRILRLDYDTFINSAFLAQGRADEFTNRTAGERKGILSDILALHLWQNYEEQAKKYLRALDDQTRIIDAQIEEIDRELGRENEYRGALESAHSEVDQIVEQVRVVEQEFRVLEEARRRRDDLKLRYDDLYQRIQDGVRELERLQREQTQRTSRYSGLVQVQATQAEIEEGYHSLFDARQRERDFNDRLIRQGDYEKSRAELLGIIASARTALETEKRTLVERLTRIEKTAILSTEDSAQLEVRSRIEALEQRQNDVVEMRRELTSFKEERSALTAMNQNLKVEMDQLRQQIDDIEAAEDARCPLCGQDLSEEHRKDLLESLQAKGVAKRDIYLANQARIDELEAQTTSLQREVDRGEGEVRGLPPLIERATRLEENIHQANIAREERVEVTARLNDIDMQLAADEFVPEARLALDDLETHLMNLGYDQGAHQTILADISKLETFEKRKLELDRALDLIPELESSLADLERQLASWQERVGADQAVLDEWVDQINTLDQELVNYAQCERDLNMLRVRETDLRTRLGAAQQKVHALDNQRQRRLDLVERRAEHGEDRAIYEDLRDAFGKDGIPAMVIEAALPEIEKEANQILSQMTDGQMYVQFDTQREKVTGGVKETLDIRISDVLGTRDYSTFSGGESFRVDFSIRLALSRLLARRAGAQLRTLIIDEGFGSQDAMGRERLIQAINSIQDEFDLILVITHIDELKDAFPARIEVTKLGDGSHVEII